MHLYAICVLPVDIALPYQTSIFLSCFVVVNKEIFFYCCLYPKLCCYWSCLLVKRRNQILKSHTGFWNMFYYILLQNLCCPFILLLAINQTKTSSLCSLNREEEVTDRRVFPFLGGPLFIMCVFSLGPVTLSTFDRSIPCSTGTIRMHTEVQLKCQQYEVRALSRRS